jgi:hypothetical protein
MIYTIHNGGTYSDSIYYFVDFEGYTDEERELILAPKEDSYTAPHVVQIMTEGELFTKSMVPGVLFFRVHELASFTPGETNAKLRDWVKKFPVDLLRRLYDECMAKEVYQGKYPRLWYKDMLEEWFEANK